MERRTRPQRTRKAPSKFKPADHVREPGKSRRPVKKPKKSKPGKAKTAEPSRTPPKNQSEKKRKRRSDGPTQSCHQCRQSLLSDKGLSELKAGKQRRKCDTCTRYWCDQCLKNRYGITVDEANTKARWSCPWCKGECNCSICRKKAGMLATGILTPLAKQAGFQSVNDFLARGDGAIAHCLQWKAKNEEDSKKATPSRKRKRSESPGSPPLKKAKKSRQKLTPEELEKKRAAVLAERQRMKEQRRAARLLVKTERRERKRQEKLKMREEKIAQREAMSLEKKKELEELRQERLRLKEEEARKRREELQRLRTEKAQAREDEKQQKRQELEALRAHVSQQRQAVKNMLSGSNLTVVSMRVRSTSGDSLQSSDVESGIDCTTPLLDPDLPVWNIGVVPALRGDLLMVAEFLCVFGSRLNLPRSYNADQLASVLFSQHQLNSLHLHLLRAILAAEEEEDDDDDEGVEDDDCDDIPRVDLSALPQLTSQSCAYVLSSYLDMLHYQPAKRPQTSRRRNVAAAAGSSAEKLDILTFLCHRLLEKASFTQQISEAADELQELQRQHRQEDREACKQINAELKQWTAQQLMSRRNSTDSNTDGLSLASEKFARQIATVRGKQQEAQDECAATIRAQLLGHDRHGTAYWKLKSVPGVLVERSQNMGSDAFTPLPSQPQFRICLTQDHLENVLASLSRLLPCEADLHNRLSLRRDFLLSPIF